MRRVAVVSFLLTLFAPALVAGSLDKPYFNSTLPGAWVSYQSASEGVGEYQYTYTRLPDRDGRAVIEFRMGVLSGPGSGSTTQQLFVLELGFDLSKDAINYMKAVETIVMQAGQGEAMLQPAAVVSAIKGGSCDFGSVFTYTGKDTINDLKCDTYAFETRCGGPAPMTVVGEVCLSNAVPFGVVRRTMVTRDPDGKELPPSAQLIQDHGSGTGGSQVLLAKLPEIQGKEQQTPGADVKTLPVQEAYRTGLVEAHVEIVAGSAGKRLLLSLRNRTSEEIVVVVPAGPTRFEAGSPLDTLQIAAERRETLTMKARGSTAPIEVGQVGKRGAVEGDFTVSIYEGEPLYSGSITMGPLG